MGGIATVLEWWPIKAYRPCPNFVERGGKYVRSGQGKFHILPNVASLRNIFVIILSSRYYFLFACTTEKGWMKLHSGEFKMIDHI